MGYLPSIGWTWLSATLMLIVLAPIIGAISVEIETLLYAGALLFVSLIIPTIIESVRDKKPLSKNKLFSFLYGVIETTLIYTVGVWIFLPAAIFIIGNSTATFLVNCIITTVFIIAWRRMVAYFGKSQYQ